MDIFDHNKWLAEEYVRTRNIKLFERYVVSETIAPLEDYENAIRLIYENYRNLKSNNLLIIGSYLASEWSDKNELLKLLNKNYESLSQKEKSITCFLNAHDLRFRDGDYEENPTYKAALLESNQLGTSFVYNKIYLAMTYQKDDAKALINEALRNIVRVYTASDIDSMTLIELTDPNAFINEHIIGTHISYANYEIISSML